MLPKKNTFYPKQANEKQKTGETVNCHIGYIKVLGFTGKDDSWFGNEQFHLNLLSAFNALENLDPIYLVFLIFFRRKS